MVTRILLLFALLTNFSVNAISQLTVTVDRNPVMVNESFVVKIEADAQLSASTLDFSELEQDFLITSSNVGTRRQIINNNISDATTWNLVLIARQAGKYQIPAFNIQGVTSRPISVNVIPATQQNSSKVKEAFVKTQVDRTTAYLQSSIQYTVKLYLSVDMQSGSLSEPVMDNANVVTIGKSEESSEIINGIRHRVVTRIYAITPQRSGNYQIKAPVFNGDILISSRRSLFSGFKTKPISAIGDDINITVKPIPNDYVGQWLPSELVDLNEQWQPNNGPYQIGDPITRIITLTAIGVGEEQMPEINTQYPNTIKTYPDKSSVNSIHRQGQLVAQRKEIIALIPTQAGEVTIPAVKIPWWNTDTQQVEYAQLPAKTLIIAPPANAPIPPQAITTTPLTDQVSESSISSINTLNPLTRLSDLTWIFLAAWLSTLLLWALHVRKLTTNQQDKTSEKSETNQKSKHYWKKIAQACQNNDAPAVNTAILYWGRSKWPEQGFTSSQQVTYYLDDPLINIEMEKLQEVIYGAKPHDWEGRNLWQALQQHKMPQTEQSLSVLEPLYPSS